MLVEQLRRTSLRDYARYLTEHQERAQQIPELRADHEQIFQHWLRFFHAVSDRRTASRPQPRNPPFNDFLDRPTLATFTILNLVGYPCELRGEQRNVVRFQSQILSSRLWITGSPCQPWTPCNGVESWRQIGLHTPHNSKYLLLRRAADFVELVGYVAAFQATFTFSHLDVNKRVKAVKPYPFHGDAISVTLHQCNYKKGQPGSSRFIEAARQVERGFLLDAVVELLTPVVGVVPRLVSASINFVDFYHDPQERTNFLNQVQIWRANDIYPLYLSSLKTCVLVSGLASDQEDKTKDESSNESEESEDEDDEDAGDGDWLRSFTIWLQDRRIKVPLKLDIRYKDALLYDLANPRERCELVLRLRLEKEQQRRKFQVQVTGLRAFNGDWKGKYCPRSRYGVHAKRARREERQKKCRERRSSLRFCVTPNSEGV